MQPEFRAVPDVYPRSCKRTKFDGTATVTATHRERNRAARRHADAQELDPFGPEPNPYETTTSNFTT
jgi:hypothetical protein